MQFLSLGLFLKLHVNIKIDKALKSDGVYEHIN